jgi:dihydrofolate reductase
VSSLRPAVRTIARMPKLIYIANVSLDGYIEDSHGNFDWTAPSDDAFAFITDLVRSTGTFLYGRCLYETMSVWETDPALAAASELRRDFAHVWQAANKIVYSATLQEVSTAKTQLERAFDPDAIRALKSSAATDLTIGGANLAAHAFRAGLVDECQLFIGPVFIGAGKPSLPRDMRADLELLDQRRFSNGVVYVRYRVAS